MRINSLALLFLFAGPAARAAEGYPALAFSGRAFQDLYVPARDHTGPVFQQANTSLWLQGDGHFTPALSARAIYQGDLFAHARLTGEREGAHLRNRLREGYAEFFRDGWQVRAGKQIIAWGKSDGVNPTDYLSAHESNVLNHDSEVTRLGGTGLLVSFTPAEGASPWNVTAVAQPWFPESEFLVPPAAVPAGVTLKDTETPNRNAMNTELAGKVAYTGQGWDASLSYFHGFDHHPLFAETSHTLVSPTAARVEARRVFQRMSAVGGDASYSSGAWVYRFESAYLFTDNNDGKTALRTPSHWDSVLGAERPIGDHFRVQGQFISRIFPRWTDPALAAGADAVSLAINRKIAAANALLQQYQHKANQATTLRGSYALEDSGFGAELLWYQGWNDGDHYLRPMVSYAVKEFLKVYLGYDHYGGPADKSIGSLQSYNALFTELRAAF